MTRSTDFIKSCHVTVPSESESSDLYVVLLYLFILHKRSGDNFYDREGRLFEISNCLDWDLRNVKLFLEISETSARHHMSSPAQL